MAAKMLPKVGERVLHQGRYHEVSALTKRAAMVDGEAVPWTLVVFKNKGFTVKANLDDMVWSDALKSWFMPGRILCRNERVFYAAVFGVWPLPEMHESILPALDSVVIENVSKMEILKALKKHKAAAFVKRDSAGEVERDASNQLVFDEDALREYVPRMLTQCAELRSIRQEG